MLREVDSGDMGIRCRKFTDGETVAGQASRGLWKMEFKDIESTLRNMEVDVAMEVARELEVLRNEQPSYWKWELDLGKKIRE